MNKKELSERDICTKFITSALHACGWDVESQIREQVYFTKGRIIVRGKLVSRRKASFADYILYYKPNIPIAVIEAKDNNNPIVSKVDELMAICDELEIRLNESVDSRRALLEATLYGAIHSINGDS